MVESFPDTRPPTIGTIQRSICSCASTEYVPVVRLNLDSYLISGARDVQLCWDGAWQPASVLSDSGFCKRHWVRFLVEAVECP